MMTQRRSIPHRIQPMHAHAAGSGCAQAVQQSRDRRLTGTVRADYCRSSGCQFQVDVVQQHGIPDCESNARAADGRACSDLLSPHERYGARGTPAGRPAEVGPPATQRARP